MPVLKLPVVHKFGIISHSQRLQLQSRIVDDLNISDRSKVQKSAQKNPFELNDEFIIQYNESIISDNKSKRLKYRDLGEKIFLKTKRKIGLQFNCENESQINLSLGWTELTILSQCQDRLGLNCLELLVQSLERAPIKLNCISVLFYLLENAMYYTQNEEITAIASSNTSTAINLPIRQLRWLQIGEYASIRIYTQCKIAVLEFHDDTFENLKVYIKSFSKLKSVYSRYKDAEISFMVIEKVVSFILGKFCRHERTSIQDHEAEEREDNSTVLWTLLDLWKSCVYLRSQRLDQLDESVKCSKYCLGGIQVYSRNWLDCYLAINVLSDCSTFNKSALDVFIHLINIIMEPSKVKKQDAVLSPIKEEKSTDLLEYTPQPPCVQEDQLPLQDLSNLSDYDVLKMFAFKKFVQLPIQCKTSQEKEKSLTTLAQLIIQKSNSKQKPQTISIECQSIIMTHLTAMYEVISNNQSDLNLSVIFNSLWSLLRAIKQRWPANFVELYNSSIQNGQFLVPIFTVEMDKKPLEERLARFLEESMLPPNPSVSKFQSSLQHDATNQSKNPVINFTKNLEKFHKKDVKQIIKSKPQKCPQIDRIKTNYTEFNDRQFQKITQHFWEKDEPIIAQEIDEKQAQQPMEYPGRDYHEEIHDWPKS